jgi:hypothetical protein
MSRPASLLLLLIGPALLSAGCATRTIVIETDPPGATVWLNREKVEAMTTPALIPFDHHGTYAVRLEKDGYEPLETTADVVTPWYSWPVLDLFSDLFFSFAVNDRQEFSYRLAPIVEPEPDESVEAAERRRAEAGRFQEKVRARADDLRRQVNEGDPAEAE